MAVGPGAGVAGGFLSAQSDTGGSVICGWGSVLPAGGHWVENGSGVQGGTGMCLPCPGAPREGLTLDAEAELLLLIGDVAGDSPDERHGQAAGNAGDRPRFCHCGAQREPCDTHFVTLTLCHSLWGTATALPPRQRGTPTSAVAVVVGAAAGTCGDTIPSVPSAPHCCAGTEGTLRTPRTRLAGQPWPGSGQMPPWAAAFLLPRTPLGCLVLFLRALKLLLSLCVCMGGVCGILCMGHLCLCPTIALTPTAQCQGNT